MDKIIQVHFKPDQEYCHDIAGLEQWDQGQKLEISGLDVDEYVEVHFSLQEFQGTAKRMLGTVKDGIIHTDIPALILEGPEYLYSDASTYSAYAWIYVSDEESAETIRKIELVIKTRPKPAEYVTPKDLTLLEQIKGEVHKNKNNIDSLSERTENSEEKIQKNRNDIESLSTKATEHETSITELTNTIEDSDFATKKYVDDAIENIPMPTIPEVDLSDYVKNTDYANESKGGIVKVNKGYGVGRLADGSLYVEFATKKEIADKTHSRKPIVPLTLDYAVMSGLTNPIKHTWTEEQKGSARKTIGAISEETLLKYAIKPTTEKLSFLNIQDSTDYKILDFGMEGKTEQLSTSGKNLFDFETLYQRYSENPSSVFTEVSVNLKPNTTYTYSDNYGQWNGKNLYLYLVDASTINVENPICILINSNTANKVSYTFTTTDCENYAIRAYTNNIANLYDNASKFQIEFGSVATDYEPYCGGIPSPNPEYPQEITNAGKYNGETGRYEIKCMVANKNLWDKEYASDINNWEEANQAMESGYIEIPVFVGKGNDVTMHYSQTLSTGLGFLFGYTLGRDKGITIIYNPNDGTQNNKIYMKTATEDYIYIRCNRKGFNSFAQNLNEIFQIELSLTATAYADHQSRLFTLTSPVPLTKWDKLIKRDSVWGWSIYGVKMIVDGSYGWYRYSAYKGFTANKDVLPNDAAWRDGYCNQMPVYRSANNVFTIGLLLGVENRKIYNIYNPMYDETLKDYGASNWIAYLNENPLEIWTYADDEQAFHPLPDEEQSLLNNLETYYGVTNIYNDQGCPMWFTYVADTKLYIDNKLNNAVASTQALVLEN